MKKKKRRNCSLFALDHVTVDALHRTPNAITICMDPDFRISVNELSILFLAQFYRHVNGRYDWVQSCESFQHLSGVVIMCECVFLCRFV